MAVRVVDYIAPLFHDRQEAGGKLAEAAALSFAGELDLVLALAKGGVQVAVEIAHSLEAPLSAVAVARVNAQGLRLGATTAEGPPYLLEGHGLDEAVVAEALATAQRKAEGLEQRLQFARRPLAGKRVLVVDDGLVTGLTLCAGLVYAKAQGAAEVVGAVPVGHPRGLGRAAQLAKGVLCLAPIEELAVVGQAYEVFDPLEEWYVEGLLNEGADSSRES